MKQKQADKPRVEVTRAARPMTINNYAWKSLRGNKSVIIMIALAAMLITAILNLGYSTQQSILEETLAVVGDNQVRFANITDEQEALLSGRREIALFDLHLDVRGWCSPLSQPSQSIGLTYSSGLGEVAGFRLDQGRAPVAVGEVAIPPHVADLLGIAAEVGAEFDVEFFSWDDNTTGGMLTSSQSMHFVVCGILQAQPYYAASGAYLMFVSRPQAEQLDHSRSLYLRLKGFDPRGMAAELAEYAGIAQADIAFNELYLKADLYDPSVIAFFAVLVLVISLAGAVVIMNGFNLIVEKKVHQYGLFIIVGATKKQLRSCVRREALYCLALGLPFGLLAGTLVNYIGLGAVGSMFNAEIRNYLSPLPYLLAIVVTLSVVMASVSRPAKRASAATPVEAVRFAAATEQSHKRPTLENVTEAALARLNLSRSKRRTLGTVVSLALSGILFIGVSIVGGAFYASVDGLVRQAVPSDMTVSVEWRVTQLNENGNATINDPLTDEIASYIASLDGVQNVQTTRELDTALLQADAESLTATYNSGRVCGVDQSLMADLIPMVYEGDPMPADFDDPHNVIAVIGSWYSREGHDDTIEQYSVGSDIVYLPDPSLVYGDKPIVFHIVGLVRAEDFAFLEISYLPTLCLPEQSLAALGLDVPLSRLFLTVDEARSDQLSVILEGLCAQDEALRFQSLVGLSQEYRSQLAGIGAFAYLILVVIALIGLVNLVASTVLSVEQRQRELGVLMAVGMSRRDVMRMLGREGVWVSLLSTALSVPLGLGLGVGLYVMLIGVGATFLQFVFPAWPLLGLIVFMGVLPYLVNRLAVSRLGRYTIVDLLGRQV